MDDYTTANTIIKDLNNSSDLDNPPRGVYVGCKNDDVVNPEIEMERTLGRYRPRRVIQCKNCASFYLEGDEEECCPECSSDDTEVYGIISRPSDLDYGDDSEVDIEDELSESLNLLNNCKFEEFSDKYGKKARLKGTKYFLESNGKRSSSRYLNKNQMRAYKISRYY